MNNEIILVNVSINENTAEKLRNWLLECNAKAVTKQRLEYKNPDTFVIECWNEGSPYFGAIGGGLTYLVTPTSLGNVIKARYDYLNVELDLTEYENW